MQSSVETVYTVAHETRPQAELVEMLAQAGNEDAHEATSKFPTMEFRALIGVGR